MDESATGHPKGLYLLFFTALWERFGFYTLQTIIVLFMTKELRYSDHETYLLYGAFSALLYLTPVLGGHLADRFMGFRQSIYIGGFLFVAGYCLLAFPQKGMFFLGLSAIIIANGFFKPSISSIVGDLYQSDDQRRESGFTIFYMGINVGALIPPLITGFLVARFGWNWCFFLAAICIGACLINFFFGRKRLQTAGLMPTASPIYQNPQAQKKYYPLLALGTLAAFLLVFFVLHIPKQAEIILIAMSILIMLNVIRLLFKEKLEQRRKMMACLILILISVFFWAFYCQTYTSMMTFADRNMEKVIVHLAIEPEFIQFFNPFFIIILSPILSWLWLYLERRNHNPSIPMKFSLGVLCMALGFLFLGGATTFFSHSGIASPWYLAVNYLLQTIGELLLSPIGLAMITRLSPRHLVGMMMGVWFLSQSLAFAIGGLFATLADVPQDAVVEASIGIYSRAFNIFGFCSMALALLSFMLVPYLKRLINHSQEQTT